MFITYKTTCIVTGKYYIGSHKTDDLNDTYLGSGKQLKESIIQFGEHNHQREILGIFDTRNESIEFEHKLILKAKEQRDPMLLNISTGGYCFDKVNECKKNLYEITPKNLQVRIHNLEKGRKTFKENMKDAEYAQRISEIRSKAAKAYFETHENGFKGKTHSDETIKIISEKAKISSAGQKNSQYGTFWITDGTINLKWNSDKGLIPEGFYRGRVLKSNNHK